MHAHQHQNQSRMARLLCLLAEVASRLFSSGVHPHDIYRNFCSAFAVTIVVFGHVNRSFLLTYCTQLSVCYVASRRFSRSSTQTGTLTRWASEDWAISSRLFLDERLLRVSSLLKSLNSLVTNDVYCFSYTYGASELWMGGAIVNRDDMI